MRPCSSYFTASGLKLGQFLKLEKVGWKRLGYVMGIRSQVRMPPRLNHFTASGITSGQFRTSENRKFKDGIKVCYLGENVCGLHSFHGKEHETFRV